MKANIRIREWKDGLILFGLIASVMAVNADKRICTSVDPECEGNLSDCSRSIPCYHGDCDGNSGCLCHACWRSEHCNEYVDKYPPQFLVKSKYIAVSAFDSGSLFVAEAVDADGGMTCHFDDVVCPCSSVRYSIQSGNEYGLFTINSQSGHVYITAGAHLTTGVEYPLVIRASSLLSDFNVTGANRRTHDDMMVTIRIDDVVSPNKTEPVGRIIVQDDMLDEKDDERNDINLENTHAAQSLLDDGNHVRRKRTLADEKPADTIMTLSLLDSSGPDQVTLGGKAMYKLEILLPKVTDMDLIVELFTNDPETKASSFRICGAKVTNVGSSVTSKVDLKTLQPEMKQNPTTNLDDRAIFNFTQVSNTDGSDNASRVIEIVFSAILIQPFVNNQKYFITAGAEYNNEDYVWVGQSEMQAMQPKDPNAAYETTFTLDGPDNINEQEAGVYTIVAGVTYPSEKITLDVFTPDDNVFDLFSVGNLRLKFAGPNFACIKKDFLIYPMTFFTSESGKSKHRGTLELGDVPNCGNDRTQPADKNHTLELEFAIFILKDTKKIINDGNLTFATGLLIGQKTIWTAITNITVGPFQPSPGNKGTGPKVSLIKPSSSTAITIPEKGVSLFRYGLVFDNATFTDTKITLKVPDTGGLSLCSILVYYRGFNIPFVPQLIYEFKDGKTPNTSIEATIDFGRIQTTGQLWSNDTANTLFIDVGVRSVGPASKEKLTLTVGGTLVDSPEISTGAGTVDTSSVSLTFTDLLNTDVLFENGETGVDMEFSFPASSPFDPFELEVMGQFGAGTFAARICRVEISSVGRLMPCVNKTKINEETEYTTTMDIRQFDDRAVMPFQRLCVASNTTEDASDKDSKMTVNFVAELPKQTPALTTGTYWLNAGIKMGPENVLAGSIKYTIKAVEKGTFTAGANPLLDVWVQDGDGPLEKGSKYVFFQIKLPPRSRAYYKLTVWEGDGNIGICALKVIHIGHNMPCFDWKTLFPGNTDPVATATITYNSVKPDVKLYYDKGIIDFGSLANVGVDPLITSRRNDRNTILIGAGIHVAKKVVGKSLIYYSFDNGPIAGTTQQIEFPITATDPTPGTFEKAVMDSLDGTKKVYDGVTTIVYVDFQYPAYVTAETVDVVFTKIKGDGVLDFCSASVTFVGFNLACIDVDLTTVEFTGDEQLTVKLGKVCHTNAYKDPEANRIRVELAFNSPDKAAPTIKAEVKIADKSVTAEVPLTTDPGPPPKSKSKPFAERFVTLPSKPADLVIPVSTKKWIPVKLTIPTNATLKFNVTVEGAYENGQAILTLYDVKVGDAGTNVACLRNGSLLIPDLTKSDSVTTQSQNNVMKVDFGYIRNTGFTDKRGTFRKPDNDVAIWFLVRMTDHPTVDDKDVFPLNINIQAGDIVVSLVQNLNASRDGKEVEKFDFNFTVLDKKASYNKNDKITLSMLVSHSEVSSLEPNNFYLRLLAPPFLECTEYECNMTNVKKSETQYFQLVVDKFLFDDVLSVNLTCKVDPNNKRKPGSPATTATMIARGVCNVTTRPTFKYPAKFHYCTDQFSESLAVGGGGGCDDDLTKIIQGCQLSASSAMTEKSTPDFGNTAATDKFWAPAFRLGKLTHHYQVDFGNMTLLSTLKIKKVDNSEYQPITSFALMKSNNGRIWKPVLDSVTASYVAGFHTEKLNGSVQTRFLRIVVKGPEYSKPDDLPIAAQFQFNGCAVGGGVTPEDVCKNQVPTRVSTNCSQSRCMVVNPINNMILVCDYIPAKDKMNCFCSENTGTSWQAMPPNIGSLVGYDPGKEAVYVLDKKGKSYMQCISCKKWTPLKDKSRATSSDLIKATPVPEQPAKMLGEITNKNWKANFDGITYDGKERINWKICCK